MNYINIFSFYILLSETNPKLKYKIFSQNGIKDTTSFSQKYDIDFRFLEDVNNLLPLVRKTEICGLLPFSKKYLRNERI